MANDLLKEIESKLPSKETIEKYKSEIVDELYNDTYVSHYLKKNNLDINFVNENLILLMTLKEDNEPCLHCRALEECKNTPKGCKKGITKNEFGEYDLCYEKCNYYKDLAEVVDGYLVRDYKDEWLHLGLNTIKPDSVEKSLSSKLLKVSALANKGLYLWGKTGTGKSYLMAALTNSLIKNHGFKACFVNFKYFIQNCQNSMKVESDFIDRSMKLFSEVDVLVLDDVGAEKISDWSIHNVFYEIINQRMHDRKLTLFTSMYSITQLIRVYGGHNERTARVIDCIRSLADEVELAGINYYKI